MKSKGKFYVFIAFLLLAVIILSGCLSGCSGRTGFSSTAKYMEEKTKGKSEDLEGYTKEERKAIFLELIELEKKADKEAVTQYPVKVSDPNYAEGNLEKYKKLKEELSQKYKEELGAKYGFTTDQMDALRREGFLENWSQADY